MPERNEGDGSRTAGRAYGKRTRHFVKTGRARKTRRRAAVPADAPDGVGMRDPALKAEAAPPGEDQKR